MADSSSNLVLHPKKSPPSAMTEDAEADTTAVAASSPPQQSSNTPKANPGPENATNTTNAAAPAASASASSGTIEFEPPQACIRRLLKLYLPKSTNVSKDANVAFSRACGIFILYLTTCANDFAREGKRSTVIAKDVLGALKELDFDEFTPQITHFLEQHRNEEKKKKNEKERLKNLSASGGGAESKTGGDGDAKMVGSGDEKPDSETPTKQHSREDDVDVGEDNPPVKKRKVNEDEEEGGHEED